MVAIIFNGIHYSQPAVSRAIEWCLQSKSALKGIFLRGIEEDEGYGFPSDLDAAQELSTTTDVNQSDLSLINSNMRMLEHEAKDASLEISTTRIGNPTQNSLSRELQNATKIFVSEKHDESMPGIAALDLAKFLESYSSVTTYVPE